MDTSEFVPDVSAREKDFVTIVALTRLVYRKGIDLLAVIIPDVCHRYPHVKFLICIIFNYIINNLLVKVVKAQRNP